MNRTLLTLLLILIPVSLFGATTGQLVIVYPAPVTDGRVEVIQTSHGFSPGQWIMYNATSDTWELLDTSSYSSMLNIRAAAYVLSVIDVDNFVAVLSGTVEASSHGLPLGPLYASSTLGTPSSTPPGIGGIEWRVGFAASGDVLVIIQEEWVKF